MNYSVLLVAFSLYHSIMGNWLCDLVSQLCNEVADGMEKVNPFVEGAWMKNSEITSQPSEIFCAVRCHRKNCMYYLYIRGSKDCIMSLGDITLDPSPVSQKVFVEMRKYTNVALQKTTHATSVYSSDHPTSAANDGNLIQYSWISRAGDENPHLVIDLGQQEHIKTIRVASRPDQIKKRFPGTSVAVGNTYVPGTGVSPLKHLATIERVSPSFRMWFNLSPILRSETYRYVMIYRTSTVSGLINKRIIEIGEIEVYVLK